MWGYHEGQGWWMVFGFLAMAVFWGGLAAILYVAVMRGRRHEDAPGERRVESPEAIATRRYAAGEIDEEEFDRIMGRLGR